MDLFESQLQMLVKRRVQLFAKSGLSAVQIRHGQKFEKAAGNPKRKAETMIQIKEFIDTDASTAEKAVNEFLAELREDQFVNIRYESFVKKFANNAELQRSAILVIYRTDD